jgi:hypothetical protein
MTSLRTRFEAWLDGHLVAAKASKSVAYNFHLYEYENSFGMQLVGVITYDQDDPFDYDDEVFSSKEDIFMLPRTDAKDNWRKGLKLGSDLVRKYLDHGRYAHQLTSSHLVGVGFVDGDIEIIHRSSKT